VKLVLASMDSIPAEQIGELAKQGSGWLVAIILGWVVLHLWKEQRAAAKACDAERVATAKAHEAERATWWQARLADWKEIGTLVSEQNVVQAQLTAARETGSAATSAMAEASKLQAAVMTRLIDSVDRAIVSMENVRDTILRNLVAKP
jgi:hypothetical protein